ncbi:class I SAM-dependent methyltransferase [Candidatus Woesearchaeota archaeon]|nr:class I SAM-dependent methyltransferase [Candidatus Woesearchaeota archaeon]
MAQPSGIFYSLPEVWDFCLEKIYDQEEYLKGLVSILGQRGITSRSKILDAGCGSGFPSLDLLSRGFDVTGADKSSEMIRQIRLNAKKRGLSISTAHVMWSDLSKSFKPIFDAAYCRGNSLVYAASWEQNWIVPERSREEVQKAIKNFYAVLKPKGLLYLDVTSKDEKPHKEIIGTVKTAHGDVEIEWAVQHDAKNKIRTWSIILAFPSTGEKKIYRSYSYLIDHAELVSFCREAGFKGIEQYVKVPGERNYSVFIGHK